jgi:5'-nucleotidase/UDP-sugar diphosphatase
MRFSSFFIPLSLILSLPSISFAVPVHILHTNDLHSYFTGYADGRGGYARLKTKMDEIRAAYAARGIPTLTIDGGDFGEGTSFFLTGGGVPSLRMLGALGVEASVIGNHDYMMGGPVLANQIRAAKVSTRFLSANMVVRPELQIGDAIRKTAGFVKNGIKISVIGLSTPEPHFLYPLLPDGFFLPAGISGQAEAERARKEGADLVIALTHIGVGNDKNLAKESSDIDLIVGGHSHTRLVKPVLVKNKAGRSVPIVQAHSHGLAVGSLLLDISESGAVSVQEYQLYDIAAPMAEDVSVRQLVDEAVLLRNQEFGGRFDEVVGNSEIKLSGYENGRDVLAKTCWGTHMAKMAKEAAGAEVGLHLASFEGVSFLPGPVTYGNLVDNFPHIRKAGDPGWEVASFRVKGKVMKTVLQALINLEGQMGMNFEGLTYHAIRIPLKKPIVIAFGLKIDGRPIENERFYRLAFPAEVAFAVKALLPAKVQRIFPGLEYSGQYMWNVMERYVRANSPIKCL